MIPGRTILRRRQLPSSSTAALGRVEGEPEAKAGLSPIDQGCNNGAALPTSTFMVEFGTRRLRSKSLGVAAVGIMSFRPLRQRAARRCRRGAS
jgi:hypothetical protein